MRSLKSRIPNSCPKMWFSLSQHIPAAALNIKLTLYNWDSLKKCICVCWNPESQTRVQNVIFCESASFCSDPTKNMHHKIEIHPKLCMRSLKSRIPRRWDKYDFLQASIFQQQPNGIQFCPMQSHFSRSPNRKDALPNWDPPKIYTCDRWNPVSQTDAQNTIFPKQLYFSRSPNRKYAL